MTDHSGEYPAGEGQTFVRTCTATSGGQAGYCRLALACIERRVSNDDFVTYDQNVINGKAQDPAIQQLVEGCQREAVEKAELAPGKHYLSSEKASFLHSCDTTSGGKKRACRYAYACVVQRVSHKDFVRYGLNILAGKAHDPKTLSAIRSCIESAAERAGVSSP